MKYGSIILFFIAGSLIGGTAAFILRMWPEADTNPVPVVNPVPPAPAVVQDVPRRCDIEISPGSDIHNGTILYFGFRDEFNFTAAAFSAGEAVLTRVENGAAADPVTIPIPPEPEPLCVQFRDTFTALYLGKTYICDFPAASPSGPKLGFRGIAAEDISVIKTEPVFLRDDFMRTPEELGAWETASGEWEIRTQKNPSMSANAFSFQGKGENAIAVAGRQWWNEYSFECSLNFSESAAAGVVLGYTGADSYAVCLLSGRSAELIQVRGEESAVLERRELFLTPGQWYRINGSVSRRFFSIRVDGHELFHLEHSLSGPGEFGLIAKGKEPSFFDDVEVSEIRLRKLLPSPSGILPFAVIGGKWKPEGNGFICSASDSAEAVWGSRFWSEYALNAVVVPGIGGKTGLGIYRLGENDSWRVEFSSDNMTCSIINRIGGKDSTVHSFPLKFGKNGLDVTFSLRDSVLRLGIDGHEYYSRFSGELSSGAPFLFAEKVYNSRFSSVTVEFFRRSQAVETGNEIFTAEYSMAEWAGSRSDWVRQPGSLDGKTVQTFWHKASFPGDVLIEADCGKNKACSVELVLGAEKRDSASGYSFRINSQENSAGIYKKGKPLCTALIPEEGIHSAGFKRIGTSLVGLVNHKAYAAAADPADPLPGTNAGWLDAEGVLNTEDVWVFSDSLFDYSFTRSPDEWRAGGGTWEVTNRWQCDPRWRFFSGYVDKGNAVLWNKRLFDGDITVECYVGIKMNNSKGKKYSYASDLNLVICSDGKDASLGYNFMFGGYGNTVTCIKRNGETVSENREVHIPVEQNIHRRWFYLKAEKKDEKLVFSIDGKSVCEYTDPDPLKGNRIAFWTHDNGMMVARVRISSESGREFEIPFVEYPSECRTVYDH